jgi:hypothetical protein
MVQVAGQLSKFGTCVLFLAFVFFLHAVLVVLSQLRAYFFVLGLHMLKIILTCVEVVLVLARVVATIAVRERLARGDNLLFLDDLGHGMVEFFLSLIMERLDAGMEESSALVPASDALDESAGSDGRFEGPLDFQHAPVLLQIDNCARLFIALLFRLTR